MLSMQGLRIFILALLEMSTGMKQHRIFGLILEGKIL